MPFGTSIAHALALKSSRLSRNAGWTMRRDGHKAGRPKPDLKTDTQPQGCDAVGIRLDYPVPNDGKTSV